MLFTLGLLLLLTPFPSFQTPTNEKRNSTGSDLTKPNAVFTLPKPKTSGTLTKQTIRATLKPNMANQTASPTSATNQKPSAINPLANTKSKPSPAVIQTTPSTPVRATTTSATTTKKEKHTVSVNQTVPVAKSPSVSEGRVTKEKAGPAGAPNVQSASKPASAAGAKATKGKPQPSVNQTVSVKPPVTTDGKAAKDKPASTVVQNVQSTPAKSAPASGTKSTKVKLTPNNQTVVAKPPSSSDVKNSKDKPAPTAAQSVPSTPVKGPTTATTSESDKDGAAALVNQTTVLKSPTGSNKAKPVPAQPIKVVISEDCESSRAREQEVVLKPGAPLVMTHKISLVPGGCTGGCDAEMVALKGRVARLEREMSSLKEKCSCSANCPNDCSGNGACEKGRCVCQQGFVGQDCSKCAQGVDCSKKLSKGNVNLTVDTVALKKDSKENVQEKNTKAEHTLFERKDQKKVTEAKETDAKSKGATTVKVGVGKTQTKIDVSDKKITSKGSTKTTRPSVAQVLLKHDGKKQEEARKGKTTILSTKRVLQAQDIKLVKEGTAGKSNPKSNQLKDEPQANVTQSDTKKSNGTTKIVTFLTKAVGTNKTRSGKDSVEQSTLAEKNVTQTSGTKHTKKVKVDTASVQSVDEKIAEAGKSGKGKVTQKSQYKVNVTLAGASEEAQVPHNKTTVHGSVTTIRRTGGAGLGSVKVVNVSSYSFTVTWSAPQGMFKNFTVIRREPLTGDDGDEHEDFEEDTLEGVTAKNRTETQAHHESMNTTTSSSKVVGSRGKAEARKIIMVVPGNVRSVEFSNLRANTRYVLQIYGAAAERRSKIHRFLAATGPEPATEMVFSNVTETSLTVSWTKPKTPFTGFRVTYTHIVTGETRSVNLASQQSHVVLSKLSAGSSYIITVSSMQGRVYSEALASLITTVPAPPMRLQAVNVTDTRALLQWTPSLGKVDRFIITYESSKTPNVTVTVMLSGNSVEHQLRGLQKGTLYTVKVLSQKDSLQSSVISTTFTTANVVKASEVGARSALIAWRSTTIVYHSYRVIYQVVGEETQEVILEPTVTEYKLTGLLPMSRYIVLVQGEKDGQYTSVVTTEFITGKLRFPFPTECSQELLNGALHSGEVDIYPSGKDGPAVRVYCDMETDGGGWTVFQRRMNGKRDFYRTWNEYSTGFGNLSEEFWLGNELLHNLTNIGPVSLRVDMRSGNDTAYAHYANFSIDSEDKYYALAVSGYTGTAGDSMKYHNGRPFSSRDKDPDSLGIHCAKAYMGGWWYKNCYKANLNGLYGSNSNNQGVVWIDWKGKDSSIPFTEMKFRPSRFSPATHG